MPGMPPPFAGLGNATLGHGMLRPDVLSGPDLDEELIPTAIVIKNIPFAVKKESLVGLMTEMGLPLPYAFNYHFDNGIFRGLAFANFTTPDETHLVISALNNYELLGRKLRVEYKKMLPQAERDRIEERKRRERGQLQEQHEPSNLRSQASMGSMSSGPGPLPRTTPSPVSMQVPKLGPCTHRPSAILVLTS
jgi:RNA recognition motif-containing protein